MTLIDAEDANNDDISLFNHALLTTTCIIGMW